MGSYMNFKNFVDSSQPDGSGGGKADSNFPLARQTSIYSLTFDELQNTLGGSGKDFGSMNMEDLLKSIWTAEESQALASSCGGVGNLQRQGSLTLPRTLSQKTVDEVWRDVLRETIGVKDGNNNGGPNLGPKEPTFSEMTLEEFLARAGVVKEDNQNPSNANAGFTMGFQQPSQNFGVLGNNLAENNNMGLNSMGFQQPSQNFGVLGSNLAKNNNMGLNSPNFGGSLNGVNMIGVSSSQQEIQHSQPQPQLQPLFPKDTTLAFSAQLGKSNKLSTPVTKGPVLAMRSPLNNNIVHGGAMAMGRSPGSHLQSHAVVRSNIDTPSISPLPYNFGEGGGRGRRSSGTLEKVVERRRKRMIKNRESAARSRARKQAYTLELEAEIAKLKEMNEGLLRKQEEIEEMQKNETLEATKGPWGCKRICLRRTVTGPW